jgi:dolichol-phosphate mannosyltransferase
MEPLRLATYASGVVGVLAALMFVVYAAGRLIMGQQWPAGFATLVVLLLLSTGMNALFFGIIGEYLGRVYHQVRKEPRETIEAELNLQATKQADSEPAVPDAA